MNQTPKNPKTYYVTTSIPYANAKPHLGHSMEFIQGDVLARWHRQQGTEVRFQIGTDEHGQKLYEAAEEAGQDTLSFVSSMSQTFVDLAELLNISHDVFVRTTANDHKLASQKLWEACSDGIYKGEYKGLYCTACEQYYTAKDAVEGYCPVHPNRLLEELSMESYFLKLAPFQARLIDLIKSDEYRIFPQHRKNEILSFLENNELEDLSVSRPKSHLTWGVVVPGDPEHVMYVWFDALANYITTLGYPDGADLAKWWPADLHIVGKDISRFHAVYWPIMLMTAGIDVPQALYVHGFINAAGGVKMSKSLGNVVAPEEVVKIYGVDALRYYLLRYIPHDSDGDFSLDRVHEVYTADLANDLGNLVQRIASMLVRYNDSVVAPATAEISHLTLFDDWTHQADFNGALATIFAQVSRLNKRLEETQPWTLAKTDQTAAVAILSDVAHELVGIATELWPFLPDTATKIRATFKDDRVDSEIGILFPRVEREA